MLPLLGGQSEAMRRVWEVVVAPEQEGLRLHLLTHVPVQKHICGEHKGIFGDARTEKGGHLWF